MGLVDLAFCLFPCFAKLGFCEAGEVRFGKTEGFLHPVFLRTPTIVDRNKIDRRKTQEVLQRKYVLRECCKSA